jgi:hypothetical protein
VAGAHREQQGGGKEEVGGAEEGDRTGGGGRGEEGEEWRDERVDDVGEREREREREKRVRVDTGCVVSFRCSPSDGLWLGEP